MVRGLALLVALSAAGALAQTDAEKQAAEHFDRGTKLYGAAQGDARLYEAALAEFEAAHQLTHAYQVLFNIAVTQKKLSRFGEALKTFEQYLKDGGPALAPERREAVEKEIAELHALVAEVQVNVAGAPAEV